MEGDDGFDFDNFEAPRWVDFSKMNENIQDDSWFGGSNRPCNGDDVPTPGNEEENEFECQKEEEFQDNDGQELDDDFFGDEEECCEEQFEEVQEEDDFYHLNKPQKKRKKLNEAVPVGPKPLTEPKTPHLRTRIRGEIHQATLAQKVAAEEKENKKNIFRAGEIRHYQRSGPQREIPQKPLTNPCTPNLRTRTRGEMLQKVAAEKYKKEFEENEDTRQFRAGEIRMDHSYPQKERAPKPLTEPQSPHLRTHTRGGIRASEKHRKNEALATKRVAPTTTTEKRSVGKVAAVPRFLTEPRTPNLRTQTRGKMHEVVLAEKLQKEQEAEEIEPFKAGEIRMYHQTSSQVEIAPRQLTEPHTPHLRTRTRGVVHEAAFTEKIQKEKEANQIEPFKAGEIRMARSKMTREIPQKSLTEPQSPCLRTRTRGEVHEAQLAERERERESVESQGRPRQQTRPSKKRVAPVAQQRELTEPKPFGFSTEARSAMRNAMSRSENESNKKMTDGKGAKRKRGFGAEITNSPLSSGGKGNAAAAYII
mmetsp:Transcript_27918/g.38787  ORF Transcript_27918/g.38787 Transcript_27918/m.38787 type:complete len:534 (-) Transcript_27918:87-1688(-)